MTNLITQRPEPRKRRKITFIKAKATGKAKGHKPSTSLQTRPRLLAYLVHRRQMACWLRVTMTISITQRPEPRKWLKISFIKAKATGKAKGYKPSTVYSSLLCSSLLYFTPLHSTLLYYSTRLRLYGSLGAAGCPFSPRWGCIPAGPAPPIRGRDGRGRIDFLRLRFLSWDCPTTPYLIMFKTENTQEKRTKKMQKNCCTSRDETSRPRSRKGRSLRRCRFRPLRGTRGSGAEKR